MNPNPIKLYAPDTYRNAKFFTHVELLFPFWGVTAKDTMPYVKAAALQYQYSKDDFILVDDIHDADYVLMPYSYERLKTVNPEKVRTIIDEARIAGKQIIIDGAGDLEYPIDIPNSVILRVSQYGYSKKQNEITVPFPAEDLLESYAGGELQVRKKPIRPSVGFTGWAGMSVKTRIKTYLKELPVSLKSIFGTALGTGVFSARYVMLDRLLPEPLRFLGMYSVRFVAVIGDSLFARLAHILGKKYNTSDYALGYIISSNKRII